MAMSELLSPARHDPHRALAMPPLVTAERTPPPDGAPARARRWAAVGVTLMTASLVLWCLLPAVPFLPLSVAARGTVATALIVVAEVIFWGGAAMAGPEAARRMRSWRRRRPPR